MIYLIITTSINTKYNQLHYDHRKNRYINSISNVLNILKTNEKIKPIIVENNGERHTYLNDLGCDIVYTDNNKIQCQHKGVNELLDIQYVINKYNMTDDDYVIKLTGRYKILDDTFFNTVISNVDKYDAFVKFYNVCELKFMKNDCVLGLVAIKVKYLRNFNYKCLTSPECEFVAMVRSSIPVDKIYEIPKLNLECCFADNLRLLYV